MIPFLDWAVRSLSFFNTIALLWLGLTVLLNAERRTWGTWLAGGGLVLGGAFFAGHSTVVGREFGTFEAEMEFWWRVGWLPFVSPPYLWYVAMAWYSGGLSRREHRVAITVTSVIGLAMLVLLLMNPLPSYQDVIGLRPGNTLSLGGIPLMVLAYPLYGSICVWLALLALWRPTATERFMGELARNRARPWLVRASLVLLGVSLSVGLMAAWFVLAVQHGQLTLFAIPTLTVIKAFDLVVSGLLCIAIVLVGRAIASYEVFTGKTLPRGGLARQWRNSLILAAASGILISTSLASSIHPVYQLLLLILLTTLLYALHSWRVFVDRERSMERLRPFVASEHLYEQLLQATLSPELDAAGAFRALCSDVLETRAGYLLPLGQLATLATRPLSHPEGREIARPLVESLGELATHFKSPQVMCWPLDPARYGGLVWAVPLWSERGLIGLLLLGEKVDDSLYTQEEVEIARAAGERLIDIQASSEMARKLIFLQRQRLMESQVLDRRARRTLHDDVLPRIHTAMLTLSGARNGAAGPGKEVAEQLAEAHREIADLLREMPSSAAPQVARLGLIGSLQHEVADSLARDFDEVTWLVEPEAERTAAGISTLASEILFGAGRESIRNAVRYGRDGDPSTPLHLTISLTNRERGLQLTVEDDGVGMGHASANPGASGQGLALHSTLMAVIGGTLSVESAPQQYTRVVLSLPEERIPLEPAR